MIITIIRPLASFFYSYLACPSRLRTKLHRQGYSIQFFLTVLKFPAWKGLRTKSTTSCLWQVLNWRSVVSSVISLICHLARCSALFPFGNTYCHFIWRNSRSPFLWKGNDILALFMFTWKMLVSGVSNYSSSRDLHGWAVFSSGQWCMELQLESPFWNGFSYH